MKIRILSFFVSGLLVSMAALSVYAAPPVAGVVTDVRFTVHNLSYNTDDAQGLTTGGAADGRNYSAKNAGANQVCIFCHTPHNASPSVPLWNKSFTAGIESSYKLYTSSATLSTTAKGATITANSVSLLCLSCHDGKTAVNVLHNSSYRDATQAGTGDAIIDFNVSPVIGSTFSLGDLTIVGGANVANLGAVRVGGVVPNQAAGKDGTNLTDDHPIGFSYAAAQAETSNAGALKATPDAGIRLFNGRIECSSCHNPHVYYGYGLNGSTRVDFAADWGWSVTAAQKERKPFLNMSNTGSKLCLACHIK